MIEGLKPPRPGDRPQVTVEFSFDVNGILHVRATDRETGKGEGITVEASRSRLSAEDIARARKTVVAWEGGGTVLDEETEALIAQAQRMLDSSLALEGARLKEVQQAVEELIGRIRQAAREGDEDAVDDFSDELVDLLFDLEDEG